MTTVIRWLNSPAVLAFLLIVGSITDLVLIGRANNLSKSDWASWVQAVGSLVAIGIAIYAGERQHRSSMQVVIATEGIALRRRLSCVLAVIDQASAQVEGAKDMMFAEGRFAFMRGDEPPSDDRNLSFLTSTVVMYAKKPQFAMTVEVISDVPMHDLGNKDLVRALFLARNVLIQFDERLLSISERLEEPGIYNEAEIAARMAVRHIKTARDDFEATMNTMLGTNSSLV
jgi:hypothetical protein